VLPHFLGQHLRVLGRVPHHERRTEAGGEHSLRLFDTDFSASHASSVTRNEVVHETIVTFCQWTKEMKKTALYMA
jgi:hypothetical protein